MTSLILTASFVLLAGIVAAIYLYISHVPSFPPQVPSLLGGYDNGLLYVLNPRALLARCRQRYGPVYRVSFGSCKLVVVTSGEIISSVFSTSPQLLSNDITLKEMLYIISGVKGNFAHLLSQIEKLTLVHSGPISLKQLATQPLYSATNLVLLGSTFPTDTYRDFWTLNESVPYRFARTLMWFWPSYAARMRLLRSLRDYLQRGEVINCDDRFSRGFMKIFKDNNIQTMVGAQLVLGFLWGGHSNTLGNSLFLLSFLLRNSDALGRVRKEVDTAVEKFGSLEALLQADPDALDDPSFKLLTSAIMETMTLTGLHAGARQANCDFNLKLKDGTTILIKEGEYICGDVHAAHMDASVFPGPETFVVDRFAQHPHRRKHLQTEEYLFLSLGGGKHVCKGRWLAVYELRVLVIILLYLFDLGPAIEGSADWCMPRAHPRSLGITHTEDDIFVQLTPRRAERFQTGMIERFGDINE